MALTSGSRLAIPKRLRRWLTALAAPTLLLLVVGALFWPVPFDPARLPAISYYSDILVSHWPNVLLIKRSVAETGWLPLWDPYLVGGRPVAADPLAALFYPPTLLALLLPIRDYFLLTMVGHLLLAGVGAFVLARRALRMSFWAALAAGVAFAATPRYIGHLGAGHLTMVQAVAWLPWISLGVWLVVRDPGRWAMALAAALAMLVLAGHPQIAYYGLLLVAGLALVLLADRWRAGGLRATLRPAVGLGAAGAVAVLLAAPHLLPMLEFAPHSSRRFAIYVGDAAAPLDLLKALVGIRIPSPVPHEALFEPGLVVLALALAGIFARRRAGLAILAGVALVWSVALGVQSPVYVAGAALLPDFDHFRGVARVWLVGLLGVALLAGFGVEGIATAMRRTVERRSDFGSTPGSPNPGSPYPGSPCPDSPCPDSPCPDSPCPDSPCPDSPCPDSPCPDSPCPDSPCPDSPCLVSPCPKGQGYGRLGRERPNRSRPSGRRLAIPLPFGAGTAASLLPAALALAVAANVVSVSREFTSVQEVGPAADPNAVERRAVESAGGERVYAMQRQVRQLSAVQLGVELAHGQDPLLVEPLASFLQRAGGVRVEGYQLAVPSFDAPLDAQPSAKLLGLFDVGLVLSDYPLVDPALVVAGVTDRTIYYLNAANRGRAWLVPAEGAAPPTLDSLANAPPLGEPVEVVGRERERLDVAFAAPTDSWLVIAQPAYPGWIAELDGRAVPVEQLDGVLPAVRVSSGAHRLTYRYAPTSVRLGLALAAVGLLVGGGWIVRLGILTIRAARRRQRDAPPRSPE